jgi:hypothetical protein
MTHGNSDLQYLNVCTFSLLAINLFFVQWSELISKFELTYLPIDSSQFFSVKELANLTTKPSVFGSDSTCFINSPANRSVQTPS